MKTNHRTDLKGIAVGIAVGALLFMAFSVLLAFVLTKNDMAYGAVKGLLTGMTVIAAFIAGFTAKKQSKMKGILAGLAAAGGLTAIIFLVAALLNRFQISPEMLVLLPAGALAGALGGIVSSNMR